jgi:Flp pilus assembly pilin Flp
MCRNLSPSLGRLRVLWRKVRSGRLFSSQAVDLEKRKNLVSKAKSADRIAPDQAGIYVCPPVSREGMMNSIFRGLWREEQGQDIAEYAVMLAVILVIVVGTIRLIGSNANNVFSSVASSVQ